MLFKLFLYFPEDDPRGEIEAFREFASPPDNRAVISVERPNGNRFTCRVERVAAAGPEARHAGVAHCRILDPSGEPDELIDEVRVELRRIGADADTVGNADAIYIKDRRDGYASLEGAPRARDLGWFGKAPEILSRLAGLPDGAGPEAIRSEFHE